VGRKTFAQSQFSQNSEQNTVRGDSRQDDMLEQQSIVSHSNSLNVIKEMQPKICQCQPLHMFSMFTFDGVIADMNAIATN